MNNIPIILFNRDRLTCTERLIDHLRLLGYDNLYIYDIGSTYTPLLEWYSTCPHIKVIHCTDTSAGHKAFWTTGAIRQFVAHQWIAISDSDIELNYKTPHEFVQELIAIAKDFRVAKAGLAIEIDDITNQVLKTIVTPIEKRYWKQQLRHNRTVFAADVDTTFCVVKPEQQFTYNAVRVAGNFTCKHVDWYSDWSNLTEEGLYYFQHADPFIATTLQHYQNWLING